MLQKSLLSQLLILIEHLTCVHRVRTLFHSDSSVSELSARKEKSMQNGHLRVPIFRGARETGDTVGRSWKEVVKACVHHLPELRPNGIFRCIPVWEKLWLMLVLDFERLLSKVE